MKKLRVPLIVLALSLMMTACSPNRKDVPIQVHSDPLGAYALMQVKRKKDLDNDWIFLGPTPINLEKSVNFDGVTQVSIKVIRAGFYEQVKSWTKKDFIRESQQGDGILYIPNLVRQ